VVPKKSVFGALTVMALPPLPKVTLAAPVLIADDPVFGV